jgi:hypothetical protein
MRSTIRSNSFATAGCALLVLMGATSICHAAPSQWADRVGVMNGSTDKFAWCTPGIDPANPRRVRSTFKVISSDANEASVVTHLSWASQRVRAFCLPTVAGVAMTTVTSDPSLDTPIANCVPQVGDCTTALCPEDTAPWFLQCQIDAQAQPSSPGEYIYNGTDCGNGVAAINGVEVVGQMTGAFAEYQAPQGFNSTPQWWHNTNTSGRVWGTDEGAMFVHRGKLNFVFGDTYDVETPLVPNLWDELLQFPGWRSSVLARTQDFDPSNGIQLTDWEKATPQSPSAMQLFRSDHDPFACEFGTQGECSAIPTAGFGLTSSDGVRYRFLWFTSIRTWDQTLLTSSFTANVLTLAVSLNEGPWIRLDDYAAALGVPNALWRETPHGAFGPGAIWFDRYNQRVYFFGIDTRNSLWGSIKLARVRSTPGEILDPTKYEYWTGTQWKAGTWQGSTWVSALPEATPIIPESTQVRPRSEISVAYNQHSGRWLLMLLNGVPRFGHAAAHVELWQSPQPALLQPAEIVRGGQPSDPDYATKIWTKVAGAGVLPGWEAPTTFGGAPYGPMMSDHLMPNGGSSVYFMLSQWHPIYNTHMWRYQVQRNAAHLGDFCP